MEIPNEVAVLTLPNATLFPQALLPLYIFETRYRRMLADSLKSHRMFAVAMQKPGRVREAPSVVAGLGLIRVAIDNPDGTSHLILQGLSRVEMLDTIRYKPYRVQRIRALQAAPTDGVMIDALLAKVRDLVHERMRLGFHGPKSKKAKSPPNNLLSAKEIIRYLEKLEDADQVADLVSCALLPGAMQRQIILETVEVEPRLKCLIHFLMEEIREHRKTKSP